MIIHALESAGLDAICQIRKAHAQLMQRGYAKGCGECHCTAMLRAASVAVNVKLVKKKFKRNSLHVAGDLQDIVMHLAFWRLCPKVSSRNIPEFVALNEAVRCFKSEIDSCQPSPTVATLIRKVTRRGITPPRGASKETLLHILASKQAAPSRPTKTLDESRVLVHKHEGERKILAWSAEECRTFLSQRKSAPGLRKLGVESGIMTSSSALVWSKNTQIERLAKSRRMY